MQNLLFLKRPLEFVDIPLNMVHIIKQLSTKLLVIPHYSHVFQIDNMWRREMQVHEVD